MQAIVSKLLPALSLPALLLAGSVAQAATLDTTSGSLSDQVPTAQGFDFLLELDGLVSSEGLTVPTSVILDCSVDQAAKVVDCVGTMTVGNQSADISMGYDNAKARAAWAIDVDVSNGFKAVHSLWGEEVMGNAMCAPDWVSVPWFDGSHHRVFYYSSSWAETFASITGLPYSTVTDIWTW